MPLDSFESSTSRLKPPPPVRFDIQELNPHAGIRAEDDVGMLSSVRTISSLIAQEVDAGIPSERIVVGGFSQGAVISYLTGITSERKLAGVAALSGFLGMADKVKSVRGLRDGAALRAEDVSDPETGLLPRTDEDRTRDQAAHLRKF